MTRNVKAHGVFNIHYLLHVLLGNRSRDGRSICKGFFLSTPL